VTEETEQGRQMRKRAWEIGRAVALGSKRRWPLSFDDSLTADVMRFQVLRELRREFPGSTPEQRDHVIEEML